MLYYKGHKILGVNFLPRYTLAQYTALSVKPHYWIRTDAPFRYSGVITTLDDLSDVAISNPTDKQVLTYNATSQKWENKDAMGGMLPQIIASTDTGSTVVATKGGTTIPLTETSTGVFECVLYNGSDTYGEWTLTATLNGDTKTTTVDVDTVKIYTVAFAPPIPDGSTVLPTDDIEILLNCANIWDSPITTLSELLADSTTLATVINDNNAIDYLVRSTTFAKQNALVPTMTSNTTPSGLCFGTTTSPSGAGDFYNVFDENTNTAYYPGVNLTNCYVGYQFTSAKVVKSAIIECTKLNGSLRTLNFKLQGSNDGTNYIDLGSQAYTPTALNTKEQTRIDIPNNSNSYQYYRIFSAEAWSNPSDTFAINKVQFYTEQGFCDNATAMTYIGANNYASDTLLADSTWLNAICNSTYFESVLNVKVPTMTSDSLPSGTCAADSISSAESASYKAFDNDATTFWSSNPTGTPGQHYNGYTFTAPQKIKMVELTSFKNAQSSSDFEIKVSSHDGGIWTDVSESFTFANTADSTTRKFAFVNDTAYSNYAVRFSVDCTAFSGQYIAQARTIQFYGRQDV